MENGELITTDTPQDLTIARDPVEVLKEAKRAAQALTDVLKNKKDPVIMNGQQYLEFEDWQVVAKFYGITAKVVSTNVIQFGDVVGFEARAVAYHIKTEQEISAADAMCLNDEDKWSSRAKYEFKAGKRTKVGEVPVPLFQLRSMAQTRACAKALRNVLSWVVVMAGYKPNVAEEMTGNEDTRESSKPPMRLPERKSEQKPSNKTALGKALLDFCNDDAQGAAEILNDLTGKPSLKDISEEQAGQALTAFNERYVERQPGDEG